MSKQQIAILGATGSIGLSTLDVLSRHAERYQVFALSGFSRLAELAQLCLIHQPRYAVVANEADAQVLRQTLRQAGSVCEVESGTNALCQIASHSSVDTVMAAIVGAAGLLPTLAAVKAGKKVLLANKEALVMCGDLLMQALQESGGTLLPIDSEHNAIFQCLPPSPKRNLAACGVRRILLTASGGPFLHLSLEELKRVTPEQAICHPNWSMGRKISVDSASMMNKGLELIEACHLFAARPEQVEVLIHPQSVIHSLVDYIDGSVLAQLGNPDMRTPIAQALAFPERIESGVTPLNLLQIASLTFYPPDNQRFPCLRLARQAIEAGGTAPALLNAANEVAVEAFLAGRIGFTAIAGLIEEVLQRQENGAADCLEQVLQADKRARICALQQIEVLA